MHDNALGEHSEKCQNETFWKMLFPSYEVLNLLNILSVFNA